MDRLEEVRICVDASSHRRVIPVGARSGDRAWQEHDHVVFKPPTACGPEHGGSGTDQLWRRKPSRREHYLVAENAGVAGGKGDTL